MITQTPIVILILLTLSGCSPSPASIHDTKWRCKKPTKNWVCNVEFKVTNTTHIPAESIIRIRAHKRESVLGSDAIRNIVINEKVLHLIINPGVTKPFSEELNTRRRPTQIVVTISSKEK